MSSTLTLTIPSGKLYHSWIEISMISRDRKNGAHNTTKKLGKIQPVELLGNEVMRTKTDLDLAVDINIQGNFRRRFDGDKRTRRNFGRQTKSVVKTSGSTRFAGPELRGHDVDSAASRAD